MRERIVAALRDADAGAPADSHARGADARARTRGARAGRASRLAARSRTRRGSPCTRSTRWRRRSRGKRRSRRGLGGAPRYEERADAAVCRGGAQRRWPRRPLTMPHGGACSRTSTTTRTRLSRCSPSMLAQARPVDRRSSSLRDRGAFRAASRGGARRRDRRRARRSGEARSRAACSPRSADCERDCGGESRAIGGNGGLAAMPCRVRGSTAGFRRRRSPAQSSWRALADWLLRRRRCRASGKSAGQGGFPGDRQRRRSAERARERKPTMKASASTTSRPCRSSPRRCTPCAGCRRPATPTTRGRSSTRSSTSCRARRRS